MNRQFETLTPEALEKRLAVVTDDFKKVLDEAKKKRVKVDYTKQVTAFGTYPLCLTLTDEKY